MTAVDATVRAAQTARTMLFVPGSRPDRFAKASAAGADLVVLDLEDAVAESDKVAARAACVDWLRAGNAAAVRVNAPTTGQWTDDVAALADLGAVVMMPKASDPGVVAGLAARTPVIALVETAAGVAEARAIAAVPGVVRIALGHLDLCVELGVDPDDREALLVVRSSLVLAAAAAGSAPPVDGVTTSLRDVERLRSDVDHARRLGFAGKLCIHPAQVDTVHAAWAPSAEQVAWAREVLASVDDSAGAAAVGGAMVDPPVLARARHILAAADG
ncbi:CoA ester lyase [uncultured Williamsia sp.]|uniref:HpcH/HpaI aldolase/citrate lyase family protein n=1 Tax=uncultured Williamsia sp. TaxID=259311 RepID=UPI00262A5A59|nr:CoA ester lyase [uncultured Williamsia sp.]